jgi:hypothetical protein
MGFRFRGADRLPTDSPPTPSTTPRHPPAAAPRLAGTGDSPHRSVDAAEAGLEAGRESLPRSADGPTLPGSITPPPKRRPPSPRASDRRRTGRGAPHAESAPAADRIDDAAAAVRHSDDAAADTDDGLNPTRGLCGPLRLPLDFYLAFDGIYHHSLECTLKHPDSAFSRFHLL